MDILITHGYLLTGTGSNLYVNNLVREWCKEGHNVLLLNQDYNPIEIDYVEKAYVFNEENSAYRLTGEKATPYPGSCISFKPNLNKFLPVYVYDHYDGFEVKEFPDCTDAEIEKYISQNLNALHTVLSNFKADVIQTNHSIMFPYIVSRLNNTAKYRHFITEHGSSLNFSIKKDRRFLFHTEAGYKSADAIFVDSGHGKDELETFLTANKLHHFVPRIKVIPPGADISNFRIHDGRRNELISKFIPRVLGMAADEGTGRTKEITQEIMYASLSGDEAGIEKLIEKVRNSYDYRSIDKDAAEKISAVDFDNGKIVLFVGKYLWTKGIYLILCAMPLILKKYPETTFIFSGFGPFRETAEVIINLLARNKLDVLIELVNKGSPRVLGVSGDGGAPLPFLKESLNKHRNEIQKALDSLGLDIRERVVFTGIIKHDELKYLLPCADILAAPSVFPEAFGMVAVEAMACGVYPVLTYQSAFKEITDELCDELKTPGLKIEPVELGEDTIMKLHQNVVSYFELMEKDAASVSTLKQILRDIVLKKYSWSETARKYLEHYTNNNF